MTKRKDPEHLECPRYYLSNEEIDELWKIYNSGKSVSQISKKTGIGSWAIRDRFKKKEAINYVLEVMRIY